MRLKHRVAQIERKRHGQGGCVEFSAIFICELGGVGGNREAASAKLLIGPQAGEEVTKTAIETYAEFEERVETLLQPEGRTHTEQRNDVTVRIGG